MVFQWGNLTVDLLQIFQPLVIAAAVSAFSWGVGKVAPGAVQWLEQQHADSLLNYALTAGIAKVEGAVSGKTVTIPIANAILAEAAGYIQNQAPVFLAKYGPRVEAMLIARLSHHVSLPPEASAANLGIGK